MADQVFTKEDIIYTYTSKQATEDGFLFDLDQLLNHRKLCPTRTQQTLIKYVTSGLLAKGYWNDRCQNGVLDQEKGTNPRCQSCPTWIVFIKHGNKNNSGLPCKEPTLNVANIFDLLMQAQRIFQKKPADDYFASGNIELPDGKKQKIFIAQNETGRYTAMLPEDY
jgi:hypothetical protein